MSGERARLFVALELPPAASQALAGWGELVAGSRSGLRPVRPEALHVTLCFLGWRAIDELARIGEACEVVSGESAVELSEDPVDLSLGPALCLPARRPRVVAVALQDTDGALRVIQAMLSRALVSAGVYRPERRPFLPHVTVARVRAGAPRIRATDLPTPPALAFAGSSVTLYRSRLQSAGARYEPQRTVILHRP